MRRRRPRKPMTPRFDALEARQLLTGPNIWITSTGAHAADFPVTACHGPSQDFTFHNDGTSTVTVDFEVDLPNTTADAGEFYFGGYATYGNTPYHGTISVPPAGATLTLYPQQIFDDYNPEPASSQVTVKVDAVIGCCGLPPVYTVTSPSSASIIIDDADQTTVSIQATCQGPSPRRIDDDASNQAIFTVTRTGNTTLPLDLVLRASQDWNSNQDFYYGTPGPAFADDIGSPSAAFNPGYAGYDFNVTMPAGATTMTVTVNAREAGDDSVTTSEADSILTVTLLHNGGYGRPPSNNNYTIGNATDSVSIYDEPPPQVVCPTCPVPFVQLNPDLTGNSGASSLAGSGVNYATGALNIPILSGLGSSGMGTPFGGGLVYTNRAGVNSPGNNGYGIGNADLPSLQQTDAIGAGTAGMMVNLGGSNALFYNLVSGAYVPYFFYQVALAADPGASGDYVLSDTAGDVVRFHGFGPGIKPSQQGQFKSYTDPAGNTTTTNYDVTSGKLTNLQRSDGTATETYAYSYVASGPNAGMVQSTTLQRTVGGTTSTVRQEVYAYYDGTQPYGNPGDLQLAQIQDGLGNLLDTAYYRYYTPADADLANGYVHGLKYSFGAAAYTRLLTALAAATPATTPGAATDIQVAPYADTYLQYNANQQVSQEVTQGTGCSCAGGLGTYTYAYYTNPTPGTGPNAWVTRTIETQPDGKRNIVYTNASGEVMLSDLKDVTDAINPALVNLDWITYNRYDSSGRMILTAQPSAMLSYSESYADLTNNLSATYVAAAAGVINLTDYGASTTATATVPGDVVGYLKDHKVQNGSAGTPILLDALQYFARNYTVGAVTSATIYPVASTTAYRNTDGTGAQTTSLAYTWFPNTNQVQSTTVSRPVVSAAQNGPGTADVATTVNDAYGRPIWTRDAGGFLNYTAYDNKTGSVTKTIVDVNTALTGDFSSLPAGWSTPAGGGLHLITGVAVDGLGRPTAETDPLGNVTYTVYDDLNHTVRAYRGWNAITGTATGPTEVTRQDRLRSYTESLTMSATPVVSGLAGSYAPTGAEAVSGIQTLSRSYTDTASRVIESDQYFSMAGVTYSTAARIGTSGTNYYATTYAFDRNGHPGEVRDANGTATETLYDGLGRVTAVYVGTDASKTNTSPWTPANATTASLANMVQVAAYQYDGNGGGGDGVLTRATQYPDAVAANARVTAFAHDWRDRLVATKSGVQATEDTATHRPIVYRDLDNLGEVTAVSRYDGDGVTLTSSRPSASQLWAYAATSFDDQGRAYQSQQYSVDQGNGTVSANALTTRTYFDHRGHTIAVSNPGGLVTKATYDGAGRPVEQAQTDGAGGSAWSAAASTAGDHVLSESLITYDAAGNTILTTTKDRFDNDSQAAGTDTGELGNPTTGPRARVRYAAAYYDAANRMTDSVNVGTVGGSAYTRPSSPPTRSDTALVTSQRYDAAGRVDQVTDPRGLVSRTSYDLLGRATQTVADYTNGNPTASSNATTNYTYDGRGHTLTVTAVMPTGTPSQTTQYVYGVTTATGSGVNSNDVLAQLRQPDPATGLPSTAVANQQTYTTNAMGQRIGLTDGNGSVHAYAYDLLGRRVSDAIVTLGTGVDGAVRRLQTAYDTAGRASLFTGYDAATGGAVVNQVQRTFNGLGQLTGEYQSHSGAVVTATTPEVQYAYTLMAGGVNNSRPTSMTYPNGRVVDDVYNAGIDAAISRLSALADDASGSPGTTLEGYAYLGLGTLVTWAHPQTGVDLTYVGQSPDSRANADGGDRYTGLDRFGRVIDQNWVTGDNTTSWASTDRLQYGYDRAGDRLYQNNLTAPAQGELYRASSTAAGDSNTAYDGLGREVAFARGTLSSSGHNGTQLDTIATATHGQSWALDALGNWSAVTTDGTTTTRTANAQNQTTSVSGGTAPTYDANGNTQADGGKTTVFDAWNRLVAVKNGVGTTLESYQVDALGRRIVEDTTGSGGSANHLYYSPQWQVIEERVGGTAASNLKYQEVWGAGYVDDLVLRDTYASGALTQRLYAERDANHDVTAILSTAGVVQERDLYDPYGAVTFANANYTPIVGNASGLGWQYLHQGGRLDGVTGWEAFRNRDLIVSEGRWAERDPMGLVSKGINIYRYENTNPENATDSTGLYTITFGGSNALSYMLEGDNWTPAQKAAIFAQLARFSTNITGLISQIYAFRAQLTPCELKVIGRDTMDLIGILQRMGGNIAGTSDLHLAHSINHWYNRGTSGLAQAGLVRTWIWLSDDAGWESNPWILFHELSHLAGTVDTDPPSEVWDASLVQGLNNGHFFEDGMSTSQLADILIKKAKAGCACGATR